MYTCECGKEFENYQSFNGHKSHCKTHQLAKHGLEYFEAIYNSRCESLKKARIKYSEKCSKKRTVDLEQWVSEQHVCECCGKLLTEKFGSGRFCSRACANSRIHSEETKQKISSSLNEFFRNNPFEKVHMCKDCGNIIEGTRGNSKYCETCASIRKSHRNHRGGQNSAAAQAENRRSKNEIYFCSLCEQYFTNVLHNVAMFNGWDADIIIQDLKVAVMWNGNWHYKKITENHSVLQVQNRDALKIKEIESCGYIPYVIKDTGKYNKSFVEEQFKLFLEKFVV